MTLVANKSEQIQLERSDNRLYMDTVKEIDQQIQAQPGNPELWMQKGLALRQKMFFREAIEAYSIGLSYDPFHALLYRHRGHALVNIRRYSEAAADFTLSLRINPLNWDCWYHLGLAYYLMGDYRRAKDAYQRCLEITDNDESLSAATDWYWMTLMNLGEKEKAQEAALNLKPGLSIVANKDYYQRVLIYSGRADVDTILKDADQLSDHLYATQCFGIAFYFMTQKRFDEAYKILKTIEKRDTTWGGFAESAAFEMLNRFEEEKAKWSEQ